MKWDDLPCRRRRESECRGEVMNEAYGFKRVRFGYTRTLINRNASYLRSRLADWPSTCEQKHHRTRFPKRQFRRDGESFEEDTSIKGKKEAVRGRFGGHERLCHADWYF